MTEQLTSIQAIIDADDLPCFALDRELRYTAFNQAHAAVMRELYGAEISLGGCLSDYQTVAEDRETARANLERVLTGEVVVDSAFSGGDGDRRYFDVAHTPFRDDAGAVVGVVVRARDVNRSLQNDRRYGLFFEHVQDGFAYCHMLFDEAGRPDDFEYIAVNPSFERLTGLSNAVGKRATDLLPTMKANAPELLDLFGAVVRSGEPVEFEGAFTPVGIWLHVTVTRPEADHFVTVFSDITERKAADQARLAVEARRLAILDTMLDPHALLQAVRDESGAISDFAYLDANRAACEYLGLEREQLIGSTLLELVPGHVGNDLLAIYAEAAESGRPVILDDHVYPHELLESERRFDIRGVAAGDTLSITWRDVTERHAAAAALADSEARLRAIVEGASEGINVLDLRTGRYAFMSPAQLALMGFTAAESDDLSAEGFWERLHPDDRETWITQQKELAEGHDESSRVEYRWRVNSGEYRWFRDSRRVLTNADGERYAIVGVSSDITEQIEAEQEIQRLNAHLERCVAERTRDLTVANTELEDFVYSIAHDLRSPLRALGGFSEIVRADYEDVIDETGRDYLQRIHDAAVHMDDVMDSLLALSRVNRTDLLVQDVDLSTLARVVTDQLREADPERSVQVEIEDGLIVRADRSLCEVLLQNLLGNAWKFSSGRSPARISFGRIATDDRSVYCVSDNGIGFEQKYAERLFKPFERLHTPDEFPGTGIGLATVGRIIARFGGDCWAEGSVGEGARVFFTLPVPDGGD